jgi:hypothetical protein
MANTSFKVDNGLLVTGGDSLFQANVTVNAHVLVRQSLAVNGNLTVTGNLTYSNTSIDGDLVPTANGKALGNTTRTFNVFAGNLNLSNSIVTANGIQININALSGLVANSSGFTVNASAISNGVLNIGQGGTNAATRTAGLNNLLPTQNTAVNGFYLRTNGTDASWVSGIGFTGSKGDKGDTGNTGFTGSQGSIGFTGSAAADGTKGDTGFTGSQGPIGFTGSQGTVGFTGSAGTNGSNGNIGFTGSQGPIGFTGSQGTVGFTGSQGTVGFTGSWGGTASSNVNMNGYAFVTSGSAPSVDASTPNNGTTGGLRIRGNATSGDAFIQWTDSAAEAQWSTLSMNSSGVANWTSKVQLTSLGVGTPASGTTGEIRATNEITAYYTSDRTFKNNIVPIENALEKLRMITGVMFDWSDDYIESRGGEDGYFVRKHDTGIIAQDVEKVLPEVVAVREDGTLAVKYEKMMGLIVQAINELADDVDKLKG